MCVNPEQADLKQNPPGGKPRVGRPTQAVRKSVAWRIVSEDGSTSVCPSKTQTEAKELLKSPKRPSTGAKTPCEMSRAIPDLSEVLDAVASSRRSTASAGAGHGRPARAGTAIEMKPAKLDQRLLRTIEAWPALTSQVRDSVVAIIEAAIIDHRP
jgi:hypothetical protein